MRGRAALVLLVALAAGCSSAAEPDAAPSGTATTIDGDALVVLTTPPSLPPAPPSAAGEATVVRVTDGDTFDVDVGGAGGTVRIIGVNAPEGGECLAREAEAELGELLAGGAVTLVSDVSDLDRYGRLLRYVEVDGVDVGAELVRLGLAVVRVSEPDSARRDALDAAQHEAQEAGAGLWSDAACGEPPVGADGLRIVELRLDADGPDAENLDDEWVVVVNDGTAAVDMHGWGLRDESASNRFAFPAGLVLEPGDSVRVRSGCGPGQPGDLHWCARGSAIWNNDGDTAFLLDPNGNIVDSLRVEG